MLPEFPRNDTLIMGVGNYLMGDEGVGVHFIEYLANHPIEGVDTLDGGTGGFHLLGHFEQYARVVLIDATLGGGPVGSIRMIQPHYASDFPIEMSTHDIGLKDLISSLQLTERMTDIYLFTITISDVQQQGTSLTPTVLAMLPSLRQLVKEQVCLFRQPESE